jgi:DNA repair protein RadA/Sms
MSKTKTVYICSNCGFESSKWLGHCSSCGEWNTFVEEVVSREIKSSSSSSKSSNSPILLKEVKQENMARIDTSINEFNRVLGGGLVPGSVVLIGGEPGIGKSTLALQVALKLRTLKVLYISGEESAQQISLRAKRLDSTPDQCYIACETNLENILQFLQTNDPDIIIIDSIQTLHTDAIESSPGSVSQIRECASQLLRFAKENSTPILIIGHITKEGTIAGPKILEHIVDTVLQFEGDQNLMYRILRATKNRFGSTSEIGLFEMTTSGLIEISNPSEILISHNNELLNGIAVAGVIEGIRPLLIEVQALVGTAVYSTPQRSATGFDIRRLGMLLAVLEKRAGFKLSIKDVFLNITGGIKVDDTATDLAVVASILSSYLDSYISKDICFCGEIGLSGEIRPVPRIEQRIAEASKLGYQKIVLSKYNKNLSTRKNGIEVLTVAKIEEVVKKLFA